MQMTLPMQLPDETLYSLLARIAISNGMSGIEIVRRLLGDPNALSSIGCKVDLHHFSIIMDGAYGGVSEIISALTILPIQRRLGEVEDSELALVGEGKRRLSLDALVFGRDRGLKWKICHECMKEDVATYGVAYWHRSHQITSTICCSKHGEYLRSFALPRRELHEQFLLPHNVTHKISPDAFVIQTDNLGIYAEFSLLAKEALNDTGLPASTMAIHRVFKTSLMELGFLARREDICKRSTFLRELGLNERAYNFLLDHVGVRSPRQFLYGIADNRPVLPFSRLMLVHWLFGSWKVFKQRCQWQDVLDQPGNGHGATTNEEQNSSRLDEVRHIHRQACLEYKSSCERPTRLGFTRTAQLSARWLLQNDRQWLDEEIPVLSHRNDQKKLFD